MKNLSTKNIHKLVVLMILLSFLNFNCSSDDDSNQEELEQIIELVYQDVAPEAFLQNLADCGFPLEEGNEPPSEIIDGFFRSENIGNCNNRNENLGIDYNDQKCNFRNFDLSALTLNVECRGTEGTILLSTKAYLLGSDNNFTVYMSEIRTRTNGDQARFASIFSGTWDTTDSKIVNYKSALLSVEIISGDNWILPGDFRTFTTIDALNTDFWGSEFE